MTGNQTIGDTAMTGKIIAERIGADADATGRLLNALVAMELLVKKDNTFLNVESAGRIKRYPATPI